MLIVMNAYVGEENKDYDKTMIKRWARMGCDKGTIMEKGCSNCATLYEHIFNHRIYLR